MSCSAPVLPRERGVGSLWADSSRTERTFMINLLSALTSSLVFPGSDNPQLRIPTGVRRPQEEAPAI